MPASLWEKLRAAADSEKRLRFDRFQEIALYDSEQGYFAKSAARAGRDGDFLTSPELSSLFAECLAGVLKKDGSALDEATFQILDVGAGRGTLVRDLWRRLRAPTMKSGVHFHLLERSAAARAQHAVTLAEVPTDRWTSYADESELPAEPWSAGALIANELFDNLPVRRVMKAHALQEIYVRLRGSALREELRPAPLELSAYLEAQGVRLATGQTAEVCLEAPSYLVRLLRHFRRGSLLIIDYGDEATHLYQPDRFPHGTLAAHRAHATHTDFYSDLGNQDLTAHVNFTPLLATADTAGYRRLFFGTQMKFLLANGLPEILELRLEETKDEFEKLRLRQLAKQLYHPDAMGESFRVFHARTP